MSASPETGRTVLVVGGGGYVGNVLVRRLLASGHRVRVLDRFIFAHATAIAPMLEHPRFSLIVGDLRDPEKVDEALQGATDVALLAGLVGDPVTKAYPELSRSINLDGCAAILEGLDGRGIDRFVFTSTCSNYGLRETNEPATEDSHLAPLSLYAEHKVEMEKRILAVVGTVDFTPTILRISTAYGLSARMRFDLTIAEFTRTLASGEELLVYDADTWRPYCHTADISKAIEMTMEAPADLVGGEVFNVGHGEENFTKRMVVDAVQEAIGGRGKVRFAEGGVDPRNYRVNFDKIRETIGFEPDHRIPSSVAALARAIEAGAYADLVERSSFYTNHAVAPGFAGASDGED